MQCGFDARIPDGLLAANTLLAENSRQGFGASTHTVYQGFGDAISSTALGIPGTLYDGRVRCRYTGKERDTESGNDYFGARYYGSSMGRFMSPDSTGDGLDPAPVPWADFEHPQSLNLYSYVRNNPLTGTDDDGHDCVVQTRTSDTTENVSVSSGNCDKVNVGDGQTKTYIAGTVDMSSIKSDGSGGINVGYTPYSGGGDTGVADLKAASVPDNPGLAYNWGNNAQGYQNLGTASATVGSVRGVATFYGASAAGAVCFLYCAEAAAAIPPAANNLTIKAIAYLESQGVPATAAVAAVTKMVAGMFPGKVSALSAGINDVKQISVQLNQVVREYHQTQGQR
jgi:RHS repeat-associated protein